MIALEAQQTLRIKPWHTARIECMSGMLWVTREGDLRDFIVAPGESIDAHRGVTIALALEPATVRVVDQSPWSWLRRIMEPLHLAIQSQRSSAENEHSRALGTTARS